MTNNVNRIIGHRWIIIIFIIGAALRLIDLGSVERGLHPDEALYAYDGWSIAQTGTDHRQTGNPPLYLNGYSTVWDNRPSILYPYIVAALYKFMPINIWTERLPAAMAGTILIFVIFLLARELWPASKAVAPIAAGLVAVSPTAVFWSRIGHDPILLSFFLTTMLLCLLRTKRHSAWWLAAVGCLAVGLYGYQPFKLIGPAMFIAGFVWRWPLRRDEWRWIYPAFILGVLIAGPWLYTQLADWTAVQSQTNLISLLGKAGGGTWAIQQAMWIGKYFLFGNIHFFIFLLVLFALGLFIRAIMPIRTAWFLGTWAIISLSPYLLTAHYPLDLTAQAPRNIGLIGGLELGAAACLVWLIKRWRSAGVVGRRLSVTVMVWVFGISLMSWLTNAAQSIAPRYILGGMAGGVARLQQPDLGGYNVTWHLNSPWVPLQLVWWSKTEPNVFQRDDATFGSWSGHSTIELPLRFGHYRLCEVQDCYQPNDGQLYVVPMEYLPDLSPVATFTIRNAVNGNTPVQHWKIVIN